MLSPCLVTGGDSPECGVSLLTLCCRLVAAVRSSEQTLLWLPCRLPGHIRWSLLSYYLLLNNTFHPYSVSSSLNVPALLHFSSYLKYPSLYFFAWKSIFKSKLKCLNCNVFPNPPSHAPMSSLSVALSSLCVIFVLPVRQWTPLKEGSSFLKCIHCTLYFEVGFKCLLCWIEWNEELSSHQKFRVTLSISKDRRRCPFLYHLTMGLAPVD